MAGPYEQTRMGRSQQNVKTTVHLDRTLTSSSCCKIVENMFKYLLYQRNQIPVQYDVLLREVAAEKIVNVNANNFSENHLDEVPITKEDRMKLKHTRNRERWIAKVKKIIDQYNDIIQRLRDELQQGDVAGVSFILGSSVMCGREMFTITLPQDYVVHDVTVDPDQQTFIQFFRALVTSEELVNIVNRPCSVQKFWVMIKKCRSSASPVLVDVPTNKISKIELCDLIPREDFQPSRRTHLVEIVIEHQPSTVIPMELTPCIGKMISNPNGTYIKNQSIKRSLMFGATNISKQSLSSTDSSHCSLQSSDHLLQDIEPLLEWSAPSSNEDDNSSPYIDNIKSDDIGSLLMTPRNILKGPEPIIETPTVPSRLVDITIPTTSPGRALSSHLKNCNISDLQTESLVGEEQTLMWYQVGQNILGFKDVCFR